MQKDEDAPEKVKLGKESRSFPAHDPTNADAQELLLRKREKRTMKSVNSPYDPY